MHTPSHLLSHLSHSCFSFSLPTPLTGIHGLEEGDKLILQMSNRLYQESCERLTQCVLLKCHHHFSVQYHRELSGEVLRHISSFPDTLLEQVFDLHREKERLRGEEEKEKEEGKKWADKENQMRDLATQFARFRLLTV